MDYPGDVLTAFGVVTGKREIPLTPPSGRGRQGVFGYVDCRVGLRNSRGEQTASGWATVVLPKRGQSLPLVWEVEE